MADQNPNTVSRARSGAAALRSSAAAANRTGKPAAAAGRAVKPASASTQTARPAASAKQAARPAASAKQAARPAAAAPRQSKPSQAAQVSAESRPARRLSKKAQARKRLTRLCLGLFVLVVAMGIFIAVIRDPRTGEAKEAAVPVTALDESITAEVSQDRLRQNLIIAGVDVSGKRGEDAVALVEDAAAKAFQNDLTLTFPDRTVVLQAAELQAVLDADAAVAQAQTWEGDESTLLVLPGTITVNSDYLNARLQAVADSVYVACRNTDVVFSDNWLFITKGANGQKLDIDQAVKTIMTALSLGDVSGVSLDYTSIPAGNLDMQSLYDQYCTTPVNAFYDETAGEIVRGQVGYQFDVAQAQAQVDAAQVGETIPIQLVETNPEITYSYLASLGSMAELVAFSREAMGETAPEPATYEDYPDELGAYSTEYSNNPNRTNNLIRACAILDGTVLKPGEQFSFNDVVGERTAEKGFKEAVAYVGGENVDEIGGGVCQVATTIYNAALLANLQIDQRSPHIYESHYAEQGLDATVSWPNPNFKFTNTTDDPIYIEANVSGGYVNVRLMGVKTDDTYVVMTTRLDGIVDYYQTIYRADSSLSLNESAVYQGGSNGYSVTTFRNVYAGDGTLISSEIEAYSNYQRRDRIVLVSTGSPYLY